MASRELTLLICFALTALPAYAAEKTQGPKTQEQKTDWQVQEEEAKRQLRLQNPAAAELCYLQALDELKKSHASKIEIAQCLQELASVKAMQDLFEEVIHLDKKALQLIEKAEGKKSPKLIPVLVSLGDLFENDGEHKKAEKYYERALLIAESSQSDKLTIAEIKHKLALSFFRSSYYFKAEELLASALEILMTQERLPSGEFLMTVLNDSIDLWTKWPDKGRSFNSSFQKELLKDELDKVGRTKAVAVSNWAKEVSGRLKKPADQTSQTSQTNQSIQTNQSSQSNLSNQSKKDSSHDFSDLSNPKESSLPPIRASRPVDDFVALQKLRTQRIEFYERMISIDINSLGENHPSVARDLSGLAIVYLGQKQYEKAKPLLSRALKIYESNYGANSSLSQRTRTLLSLGEDESTKSKAELEYRKNELPAIPLAAKNLEVALRLNYLALLVYEHGRIAKAENLYAWALASTSAALGENNNLMASCMVDYARVLRQSGKKSEADGLESSAYLIMKRSLRNKAEDLLVP